MPDHELTFGDFCSRCKYGGQYYWLEPCNECINTFVNLKEDVPFGYKPKYDTTPAETYIDCMTMEYCPRCVYHDHASWETPCKRCLEETTPDKVFISSEHPVEFLPREGGELYL